MAVITISRQIGSGALTLGASVAKKLGYTFIERQILHEIAKEANVSLDWVRSMEQEAGDRLLKMVNKLVSSSFIEKLTADYSSDFDEDKYLLFLKKVVAEIAAAGNVVIVGQGAQFILAENAGLVSVLLSASFEDRVKGASERYKITRVQAENLILRNTQRRAVFLSKLDPRDPNDPSLYDLCLNTSRVSLERAEQILIELAKDKDAALAR